MNMRVTWQDDTRGSSVFIIADKKDDGTWVFSERCPSDVRWYSTPPTAELVAAAEEMSQKSRRNNFS